MVAEGMHAGVMGVGFPKQISSDYALGGELQHSSVYMPPA